jgi:two-component system, cell cycle sensor histidine kinase and response regulator CckA
MDEALKQISTSEDTAAMQQRIAKLESSLAEQTQKVAELQQNETQLELTLENAPIGIVTLYQNGRIRTANPAFCNIIGYSAEELADMTIKDITHTDDQRSDIQSLKDLWQGAISDYETEKRYLRKDGAVILGVVRVGIVRDQAGAPLFTIGEMEDITERRHMLNMIKSSRQTMDLMLNTAPDIIYRLDSEGKILFINKSIEQLGYTVDELIGDSILSIVHPDDQKKAIYRINERRTGDRSTKNFELRLVKKNSTAVPYENQTVGMDSDTVYLINAEGLYSAIDPHNTEFMGTLGVARDVSDRHLEEKERNILEAQLYQAQKMESVGRLAGGIAHDFNNIMTGIIGYAELLKERFDQKGAMEYEATRTILRGAERAAGLTRQLLGFARQGKYQPAALDINAVIQETVKVSEIIFKKNIQTLFRLSPDLHPVEADNVQLTQVFTNLIINANDAMPEGGTLMIQTDEVDFSREFHNKSAKNPLPYIKVCVRDSGTGMPKDILNQIFEPFFTTKQEGKGTGLGLATVYGIVKNHHGYIFCESVPEEGTTFTLYFPVTKKTVMEEPKELTPVRGTATVLVVDDEEHIRKLITRMLQNLGYTVLVAKNGRVAIDIYKEQKEAIDLILLDMIMPEMAGRETYHTLRDMNPDVKVLLASGYSQDKVAIELLQKGVLGFIQKPFRRQELSRVIDDTLRNHSEFA